MTRIVHFHKMHGAGNDYIYINAMKYPIANPREAAVRLSARHFSIGADGLVLIGASEIADFSMRIFNADGSEAAMCGNASRCIGKYVYELGLTAKETVSLETLSGVKTLKLHVGNGKVEAVTVDMGSPSVDGGLTTVVAGSETFSGTVASMGNPHFVVLVDDIGKIDLAAVGPQIERNPVFPGRTNVEFVQVLDKGNVRMRVWERGSGITMACGTGACASLAVCAARGATGREANVAMDGGTLSILLDDGNHIQMTGGATMAFEGDVALDE